jgi:hypothetical protein
MNYTSGSHTVFQHRYHIVWIELSLNLGDGRGQAAAA